MGDVLHRRDGNQNETQHGKQRKHGTNPKGDRRGDEASPEEEEEEMITQHEEEQINNWFTYHPPGPGDGERYEKLRAAGGLLAQTICDLCPPSADRTAAIRKVREAVFTANASIACGGK